MMRKRLYVLFVLLFVQFYFSKADERFSHLSIKDGLTQSSIKAIVQDTQGYMWFGTADGLNKYNGYNIKQYFYNPYNKNSIGSNDISCLYINPYDSCLWIGHENSGLSHYDRLLDRFINYPITNDSKIKDKLSIGRINDILATSIDSMWIASANNGIYIYSKKDSSFTPTNFNLKSSFVSVNELTLDNSGLIWIGTDNGLYYWNTSWDIHKSIPIHVKVLSSEADIDISKIVIDKKGYLYIGTRNNGLIKYHPVSRQTVHYKSTNNVNSLRSNNISDILITLDGTLWVGTEKCLSRMPLQRTTFKHFYNQPSNSESISDDIVVCLYEDNSNILWIGSFIGGVNKYDPIMHRFAKFSNFFTDPRLNKDYNNIYNLCKDDNHSVWIITLNGLIELKDEYFDEIDPNEKYVIRHDNTVYGDILFNSHCGLFYANQNGIIQRSANGTKRNISKEIYKQTGQNILFFHASLTDSDGILWFSTNQGLLMYNHQTNNFRLFSQEESDSNVNSIFMCMKESVNGLLILGSINGHLIKFNKHTGQFKHEYPDSNEDAKLFTSIHSLTETSSGLIWLGTNSGLYSYQSDTKEIKRFVGGDLPQINMIYGILKDKKENIWCSTNAGLYVYDETGNYLHSFSVQDGLQSNEFNQMAFFKDENGKFYFGGINGLNIFKPEEIQLNQNLPHVSIENMEIQYRPITYLSHPKILKQDLSVTKQINLNNKQSAFSFEYAALSFSQPFNNRYKYMLEGHDNNWINAGKRRHAAYTNVPPGEYTFKVKACNNDGIWNETPTAIKIIITPPYWQKTWFNGLLIFSLLISIYIIARIRNKSLKRQEDFLKNKIEEKTKALLEQRIRIEQQNQKLIKTNNEIKEKNKLLEESNTRIKEQHENLKKLSKELEDGNLAKISFFTTISHEFRTPLTLIITPLQDIIRNINNINSNTLRHQLKTVYGNASKLLVLINQLLDFRKIETNNMELTISRIELVSFIKEITNLFKVAFHKKKIELNLSYFPDQIELWADALKIEKIIINLLSNALKFTPDEGKINIDLKLNNTINLDKQQVIISVIDTGKGIEKDEIALIFNQYYQGEQNIINAVGSGLGLAVTKQLVNLHNGTITAESELNKGTTFTIYLPLTQFKSQCKLLEAPEKTNVEQYLQSIESYQPIKNDTNSKDHKEKQHEILIIEDNIDLGHFLKDVLTKQYLVHVVNSAEEAISRIESNQPDLIVSDVMLPKMNGIVFCKKIKTDIETRHIPIILLTSLDNKENLLQGIEYGAEDYITKPFDLQHLLLKIRNLLNYRLQLKHDFLNKSFTSSNALDTDNNHSFNKILQIVEANIENQSLQVSDLCKEIGISHSQLYRRIHEATNLSIQEFIRTIRLKKASQLLQTKNLKISEIAYMVGFNDPNYFTRCFTKVYKQSPKQYTKKEPNKS